MNEYSDPAFVSEAGAWAREVCSRRGIHITGPIEQPHLRPWSTVFRIPTDAGSLYLKCCGPNQAHEPQLTALLEREVPALVPHVLALHPRHPWMVLADGGPKLREVYTPEQMLGEWERLLPRYAELQIALAPRLREMLELGTPDRRLDHLADDFATMLDDRRLLPLDRRDGLSPAELGGLRSVIPRVRRECDDLEAIGVPNSIEHNDLHDGNVLVSGERRIVFDWGDASVGHPFLSIMLPLRVARVRASLAPASPRLERLRHAYAEPFTRFASTARLDEAVARGARLGTIGRALTWHLVVTRIPAALETQYDVVASLRRVLELFGERRS